MIDGRLTPSTPEALAKNTPLVFLEGVDATRMRRRRSKPLGWLPIYIGLLGQSEWKGRGRSISPVVIHEIGHHAAHWCWLERDAALNNMAGKARQAASVIVVRVWVPVRQAAANLDVLELGPPRLELVRDLCWALLAEELKAADAAPLQDEPGQDAFWRRRPARNAKHFDATDLRAWTEYFSGRPIAAKVTGPQ